MRQRIEATNENMALISKLRDTYPHCITFVERITAGEERWHAIGSLENIIIIVVVHTYRE